MVEVIPGVVHWTSMHPKIHTLVSSYWLVGEGVLIDPLVPGQGLDGFHEAAVAPSAVLLSNRHHYRDSGVLAERFGCKIYCNRAGLHDFVHGEQVQGFDIGDVLPGGAVAYEVGALCPDDTALYLPAARAVVFADAVVRGGPHRAEGPLGFVPDSLMDDPEATKRGILRSCQRLLGELEFDSVLLAHGGPVVGDGRELLQDLVDSGGRTAFEM